MHDDSVSQATTSSPRAPQAERLSRALVVDAAITIARRDGLDALSMRRLAEELGVSTMAAYRHVAGKDTLVDDVLEAVLGGMDHDSTEDTWQEQVAEIAMRSYEVFLSVPGLADHLHGRALSRPGIVQWLEALSRPLAEADIPDDELIGFVPALIWQLRGAARLEAEWSETLHSLEQVSALEPSDAPNLRSGHDEMQTRDAAEYFRASVQLLTDGLAVRVRA
ncbi:TetR/AcrR family transcriptional regulator [Patulibacter minatonensis]|uniref:TetR/AcrR family transcriptional regulator n=1 Tax=Patulibacter minatonensis TaxID=298163 RepID=UPI00047BD485|nr:TetR/AcrR family transcriptional regulator [Patulibacter minatonensis]